MAKIKHNPQIDEMRGAHSGLVERRKVFRDFGGEITRVGRLEAYTPNPRNYKQSPIEGNELKNQQSFGNASHLAQEFILAAKNKTLLEPAKQEFLDAIMARFYAQLKGTPDPIAPKDKDGNYTIYSRPDNFIRAVIRVEKPDL